MLNTNLIRLKAISKCFSGAISDDFIHYIKPIFQNPENRSETDILHMGINDFLKLGSNIDVVTNDITNIAIRILPMNEKIMQLKTHLFQVFESH